MFQVTMKASKLAYSIHSHCSLLHYGSLGVVGKAAMLFTASIQGSGNQTEKNTFEKAFFLIMESAIWEGSFSLKPN